FVSNIDNLGATLAPGLLAWFGRSGAALAMEVARRTVADRKGGHLAVRRQDGRLMLREAAQCHPDEREEFQDVQRHRFFNSNSLWFRLDRLREELAASRGFLPLPVIFNRKTLNPADPSTERVVQLETAMGSALSLLDGVAVQVPRSRFMPVKNTADLMLLGSDAYRLEPGCRLAAVGAVPTVDLDPRYFALYDPWLQRMPQVPSLRQATRFKVVGNVFFGPGVVVRGEVEVVAGDAPAHIPENTVLQGRTEVPV
ncbi:MAG: UTP--glucose-1-phosphate uridylyltransferase, partial [Candidatus Eremiobacterota bacterium]